MFDNLEKSYVNISRYQKDRENLRTTLENWNKPSANSDGGTPDTVVPANDLNAFIAEAKRRGMSKEDTRAAWIKMGGE
jgi:hypothetical protein